MDEGDGKAFSGVDVVLKNNRARTCAHVAGLIPAWMEKISSGEE